MPGQGSSEDYGGIFIPILVAILILSVFVPIIVPILIGRQRSRWR